MSKKSTTSTDLEAPALADLAAAPADVATPLPEVVAATSDNPEPAPPCGGSWLREEDGSLRPRDAATAAGAGLHWPA